MTLSSVWLGNKYACRHKLISAQFGILAMNFHGEKPALDYTFPVHFSYITLLLHINIRASSPGLGYILIYVEQS
jgi:hypothetical protein